MIPMITNGGPHPADKWADTTAETILGLIQVADDSATPEALAARQAKRDLRPQLFALFMAHHAGVQSKERAVLSQIKSHAKACEHCDKPLELHEDAPDTVANLNAMLSATPFAAHFAQEHVQAVLTEIVGQHSADVQHIERRYHADRLKKGN